MFKIIIVDELGKTPEIPENVVVTLRKSLEVANNFMEQVRAYYRDAHGVVPTEIAGIWNHPITCWNLENYGTYENDGMTKAPGYRLWGGAIWHLCLPPQDGDNTNDRTRSRIADVYDGSAQDCLSYIQEISWRQRDGRSDDWWTSMYFGRNVRKPDGKWQLRIAYTRNGDIEPTTLNLRDTVLAIDEWLRVEQINARIRRTCQVRY